MRRILSLAAVSLFMFAAAALAQSDEYVVTGTGGRYTVKVGGNVVPGGADTSITGALDAIRVNALGRPVAIRFGADSTDTVKLVSSEYGEGGYIRFSHEMVWDPNSNRIVNVSPAWGGKITLSGNLTGVSSYYGVVDVSGKGFTVESSANIKNTYGERGGGPAFSTGGDSTTLTITGGNLSSSGNAVNAGSALKISGGWIFTTDTTGDQWGSYGSGVSFSGSKFEMTGGKVESFGGGSAINTTYGVGVAISGTAEVVSRGVKRGTIENGSWGNEGSITISGGKVQNNADSGAYAVYIESPKQSLILGGSPEIKGSIVTRYGGKVSANASFAPAAAVKYTLQPLGNARANGIVAVLGGAAKKDNFVFNSPPYELTVKGADLVITLPATFTPVTYTIINGSGTAFEARKGTGGSVALGNVRDSLHKVLRAIQDDAKGQPCNIKLGADTATLRAGGSVLNFEGTVGEGWGRISLSGKMTSTASADRGFNWGGVTLRYGVSMESVADISHIGNYGNAFTVADECDLTIKGGSVSSFTVGISINNTATVTILDGVISSNEKVGEEYASSGSAISSYGSLIISGGKVKATGPKNNAIYTNNNTSFTEISGTAEISSEDTSGNYYGTIQITGGNVEISGGKISNTSETGGIAIYNSAYDSTSRTVISGGEITSKNIKAYSANGGTLVNRQGTLEITGGKISNTAKTTLSTGGAAIVNTANDTNRVILTRISGTAEITSVNGRYNNNATIHNFNGGVMEISGGKVTNLYDSLATATAIVNNNAKLTISGNAEIKSKNAEFLSGTVNNTGDSSSILYITGGTITSTADSNKVAVGLPAYTESTRNGTVFLGGSPNINGLISIGANGNIPTTVIATGENAFNPGSKVYNLRNTIPPNRGGSGGREAGLTDGHKILTNGARFTSNFALETAISENEGFRLAASGNDVVAAGPNTQTWYIEFSLNGGTGTLPRTIRIVDGARLGPLGMPPTTGFLSPDRFTSDGNWYIGTGAVGGVHGVGSKFIFDLSGDGTQVKQGYTLVPDWTDQISVLANDRVIPQKPGAEIVVTAPVTITAGEFTIGPNPAAKQSGGVNFFWNGKAISGKLFIYDVSGSLVRKVIIADKAAANSGKRSVGSWDLTDAKGKPVSEGTYLVKGATATKEGAKVKTSALVGVVK